MIGIRVEVQGKRVPKAEFACIAGAEFLPALIGARRRGIGRAACRVQITRYPFTRTIAARQADADARFLRTHGRVQTYACGNAVETRCGKFGIDPVLAFLRTDMQLDENILSKDEYARALKGKRHFKDESV